MALRYAALAACVLATVGAATPLAMALAVALAAVVAGQGAWPLLALGAVLACARSGDALSVDALWRAVRMADRGVVAPPRRAVRYGLPRRVAALALVACAPSLHCGTHGAPCVLPLLGWLLVLLVDWSGALAALGCSLFGGPLRVLYDGNCGLCRRTMALLGALDLFGQLRPVNALDREAVKFAGLGFLDDDALVRDMHSAEPVGDGAWRVEKGYEAYQRIAWRVPALWPTLLMVYLPPVAAAGRRVYRRVADTRACRLATAPASGRVAWAPAWSWRPMAVVLAVVLALEVARWLLR